MFELNKSNILTFYFDFDCFRISAKLELKKFECRGERGLLDGEYTLTQTERRIIYLNVGIVLVRANI